jgi:chromosomal replication initiation ATPase DnaA
MAEIVSTRSITSIGTPAQNLPATQGRILVRRVLKATAEYFGTTADDLLSGGRTRLVTRRRQVAMYVARKMTGRSLCFIGRKIGDRHHTTVLHAVRAVRGLLDAGDAEMVAAVGAIMERLQSDGRQPGALRSRTRPCDPAC